MIFIVLIFMRCVTARACFFFKPLRMKKQKGQIKYKLCRTDMIRRHDKFNRNFGEYKILN